MNKVLTDEDLAKMTPEELKDLASRIYSPIRCGGAGYDENGKYYLILGGKRRNTKEINNIIRANNPFWTDEQLASYFLDEDK